jgi:hypothetical protein
MDKKCFKDNDHVLWKNVYVKQKDKFEKALQTICM